MTRTRIILLVLGALLIAALPLGGMAADIDGDGVEDNSNPMVDLNDDGYDDSYRPVWTKAAGTRAGTAATTGRDMLIIHDTKPLAYFGWYRANSLPPTGWDLFQRTIDWADEGSLPASTNVILFTYNGTLDPEDSAERTGIAVYDYLFAAGYNVAQVRQQNDLEGIPSSHYASFDLAIYAATFPRNAINIVNSGIPFVTLSGGQSDEMEIGTGLNGPLSHTDQFLVIDNSHYPTHPYPLGSLTFENSMWTGSTRGSGNGIVLAAAMPTPTTAPPTPTPPTAIPTATPPTPVPTPTPPIIDNSVSLIWQATGTNEIFGPLTSSDLVLNVVLNGGPFGSVGGAVTVDYGDGVGILSFVSATSNPDAVFEATIGSPTDTGTQVRNLNGISPCAGPSPVANKSVRLGSIVFHKEVLSPVDFITLTTLYTATDGISDGMTGLVSEFGTAMLYSAVAPTPTPSPSPTPGTECSNAWPMITINTIGKGQSPSNNAKVSHAITGHIVNPAALGPTAHRIPICAGTTVNAAVSDSSSAGTQQATFFCSGAAVGVALPSGGGGATNTASGSLACNATGCSGPVNVTEKYQSVSQDGQDKDRITLIPRN